VFEKWISDFTNWLAATDWSVSLHESFYMMPWLESTHVLTLMVSLGMLAVIDLRMLGWWMSDVPASKVAARVGTPMFIGFGVMTITGLILFTAIPVRYEHSIWFRLKVILLMAAFINAVLFHRHMNRSVSSWDTAKKPPARTRAAAAVSLSLWILIVISGRFIAYVWYDCDEKLSPFMTWATGCNVQ
jgi:hypothetical protein